MIPQANQIYRHFKGNLYRVITVAMHTETEEELVIYQALYDDFKVYARPLSMFMSEVDKRKYPHVSQKMRFEPLEPMIAAPVGQSVTPQTEATEQLLELSVEVKEQAEELSVEVMEQTKEEIASIDPLLEAYLDTDSYREKINILHGLQHRITEHMLNTMAIVIDFELPEGDIQTKYDALNDCLLTKEKYECSRMV